MSEATSDILALCVMGLLGLIFAAMVGQWIVLRIMAELRKRRPVESKPCPHCGAPIPVNPGKTTGVARFCPRCGESAGESYVTIRGKVVYLRGDERPLALVPVKPAARLAPLCPKHGTALVKTNWPDQPDTWVCRDCIALHQPATPPDCDVCRGMMVHTKTRVDGARRKAYRCLNCGNTVAVNQ